MSGTVPTPMGNVRRDECATDGCHRAATEHFESGGIGSAYCRDCASLVRQIADASPSPADKATDGLMEPREVEVGWNTNGVQYHEYSCVGCGTLARNTYSEPSRTQMLELRLCWYCNYWRNFEAKLEREHARMTIIDGHVYGPGSRTSGPLRGMAGRRFDIEYIEPSVYAGKRVTTFDLWSGSTLPEHLQERFPDTVCFLGGAERAKVGETTCWDPSDSARAPYPLPISLGIK